LVKPAERIGEIKVLQMSGGGGAAGGAPAQNQLLGGALGPMMQTILQTSAMMPAIKEMMKFVEVEQITGALAKTVQGIAPVKAGKGAPSPVVELGDDAS
jgi:hypothetical protein